MVAGPPIVGVWVVVYPIKHSSDKGAVGALPVLEPAWYSADIPDIPQNRGGVVEIIFNITWVGWLIDLMTDVFCWSSLVRVASKWKAFKLSPHAIPSSISRDLSSTQFSEAAFIPYLISLLTILYSAAASELHFLSSSRPFQDIIPVYYSPLFPSACTHPHTYIHRHTREHALSTTHRA